MVQIIHGVDVSGWLPDMFLYIPHGSDNTLSMKRKMLWLYLLYIPHGSDNTYPCLWVQTHEESLYIPHGSDNTPVMLQNVSALLHFISHMVQIIRG